MIPDFTGDYLNFDATKDGDIVEIISEGTFEHNETLKKHIYNIKVKHNDKEKIYSPNNTAGRVLQAAFGDDDKEWIGQKFTVIHVDKKMLIRPIAVEKVS